MKVNELMELLRGLDPDLRVGVVCTDGRSTPFDDLKVEVIGVRCDLGEPRLRIGILTEVTLDHP